MKETVLIFGGTGYIGGFLANALDDNNYKVLIFTRKQWLHKKRIECRDIEYRYWDLENDTQQEDLISEGDYIVNLAGENIAKARWTKKHKEKVISSRTKAGNIIINALKQNPNKIKCVINASAIGWYGENTNNKPFKEESAPTNDFLGITCKKWEESVKPVEELGIRLVIFRMGLILSYRGGFLRPIRKSLQWGLAPIFGNGSQIISWIHIKDYVNMILHTLKNEKVSGVYNAVAPFPVSQKYLMSVMQRLYYNTTIKLYIPKWGIKLIVGEMSAEILKSCRVSSEKIEKTNFEFKFRNIEKTMRNLLLEIS